MKQINYSRHKYDNDAIRVNRITLMRDMIWSRIISKSAQPIIRPMRAIIRQPIMESIVHVKWSVIDVIDEGLYNI